MSDRRGLGARLRELTPTRRLGLAVVAWLSTGFYLVGPDQQALVRLFGAAQPPAAPGIWWRPPWPLSTVDRVRPQETRQVSIGIGTAGRLAGQQVSGAEELITGDQNLIELLATAQYSLRDASLYLFAAVDVDALVAAAVHAHLTRAIAGEPVDELMTSGKDRIRREVATAAQATLDHHGVGVEIRVISLERILPPPEVAAAFNDVSSAKQDRDRLVNEATGYANELIPQARGEAQAMLRAAEGYQTRVVNEAEGQASRFRQLAAAERAAPGVTRARLHLETIERVAPKLKTTIVDSADGRRPIDLGIISGPRPTPPAATP